VRDHQGPAQIRHSDRDVTMLAGGVARVSGRNAQEISEYRSSLIE